MCATVAQRLDALLLAPLELGDRPLVLVPTGELHALPWSMLPSLAAAAARGRAVAAALAPRGDARRRRPTRSRCSSPARGCPPRREEIETLRSRHPEAPTLTRRRRDGRATSRAALDGADSVHVAAHGRFRDDNPQFCSLELADGALTVYDLERLRKVPQPDRALQLRVRPLRRPRRRRADGVHGRGVRARHADGDRRGRARSRTRRRRA